MFKKHFPIFTGIMVVVMTGVFSYFLLQPLFSKPTPSSSNPTNLPASWKQYKNTDFNFTVDYPGHIFSEEISNAALPDGTGNQVNGTLLIHSIPVEHCDLSGLPQNCTPYTRDMTIGFFITDKSLTNITKDLLKMYGEVKELSLAGRNGVYVSLGIEGEGVHYYILSLTNDHSLMITRSYMDEYILSGYQNAVGFIKLAEQEKLFEQVVGKPIIGKAITQIP